MLCQKCRSPLTLDSSLEGLNPAAYDLLLASSSAQQTPRNRPSPRPRHLHEAERNAAYEPASQNAAPPVFKRNFGTTTGHDVAAGNPHEPAMSFILLSDSQVATPPIATPHRQNPSLTLSPSSSSSPSRNSRSRPTSSSSAKSASSKQKSSNAPDDSKLALAPANDMARVDKLFEILSARSDIDHPVCVECTDMLVSGLQRKLEDATAERDAFVRFLKATREDQPTDEDIRAQRSALDKARAEEAEARAELLQLEAEKTALDSEILELEDEAAQLDIEEEAFWRKRNAFAARLAGFQSERDSVNSRFDHDSRLHMRLQQANVYNDTFFITHDGTFATINGLRLGRLHSNPVDWPEINAAWGHALLLLVTVADTLSYRFDGYEPRPMGSTSKIIRYEILSPSSSRLGSIRGAAAPAHSTTNTPTPPPKKQVLELYSTGDVLGLIGINRSLNAAMVAFLELVRQLGAFVQRQMASSGDPPLSLPYAIEGDRINDVSIKLGIGGDENWTRACKLTLTCCKFLLAHASNVSNRRAAAAANMASAQ